MQFRKVRARAARTAVAKASLAKMERVASTVELLDTPKLNAENLEVVLMSEAKVLEKARQS